MTIRVGVEMGGTFTDLVWIEGDGTVGARKVPSTPHAVHEAILAAITEAGLDLRQVERFVHGSTVATNALLTRRGASVGMITTEGFRDVLEIGTHDRIGDPYRILYRKPEPAVRRQHIREVRERIGANGEVIIPLDPEEALHAVQELKEQGVQSIAICLLNAYANPQHEQVLAALIRARIPDLRVTVSTEISPEYREYGRSVTTAVNAFIRPVVEDYLTALETSLGECGFTGQLQIMQSSGGILRAATAGAQSVRMLLSGPAAGVRGGVFFAKRNGFPNIVTLDMGGTSTDVAIARHLAPELTGELLIDHLVVRTPSLDIATVGAGGGSIARIDAGSLLEVGPASAGAYPGPACYGRGGVLPTVADAQIVAGWLSAENEGNAHFHLDRRKAQAALETLGFPGSAEEAADGILRIVNNNMVSAVRLVSTARGIDPTDFVLVAYGGGGPLHGALVAEEIGMRQVLIPWSPGLTSAFGLLVSDIVLDTTFTKLHLLDDETLGDQMIALLRQRADALSDGNDMAGGSLQIGIDVRYLGQGYELTVWFAAEAVTAEAIAEAFHCAHAERYGYRRDGKTVEVVNYRLRLTKQVTDPPLPRLPAASSFPSPVLRNVRIGGATVACSWFRRADLPANSRLAGPALIEEASSTIVVPPHWTATVLPTGDVLLERDATT